MHLILEQMCSCCCKLLKFASDNCR